MGLQFGIRDWGLKIGDWGLELGSGIGDLDGDLDWGLGLGNGIGNWGFG